MKLPKSLTTVTPFSKTLALSMFIIFPVVAFFLGMDYQQLVDMNKPERVIIEYKTLVPSPSSSVNQNTNGTISCKTNDDCPSGYRCIQAGPIVYNPMTKTTEPHLTCWKNGNMVPF